jgi:hypothetical protein
VIHQDIRSHASRNGRSSAGTGVRVAATSLAVVSALLLAACSGGASGVTPAASDSFSPSLSQSPTPSASATPTATPAGYGTLTGLPMATAAQVDRPIVVIDIAAGTGRPFGEGLDAADVIYQEFDGTGHSRLIAVFQSKDAGIVGPLAQTAPSDWRVTALMGVPVLAFAGGPTGFVKQLGPTVVTQRSSTVYPSLFRRSGSWDYASTTTLRASAPKALPAPKGLMTFGTSAAASLNARKVTHLTVTIPGQATQSWVWNGHVWTGPSGVIVTNVIVQNVAYKTLTPSKGSSVQSAQLLGAGTCTVVTGGVSVTGSWFRRLLQGITNYVDIHAVPVPLLPGHSWIILAPPGTRAVTS